MNLTPLTPEQFYAQNIEPTLGGLVNVDDLIRALADYRTHLETTWFRAVAMPAHPDDCQCNPCMQQRYDGFVVSSHKAASCE